jgi:hypothetical protein
MTYARQILFLSLVQSTEAGSSEAVAQVKILINSNAGRIEHSLSRDNA